MTDVPKVPAAQTLLATADAMVWAQEFCRIFAGRMVTAESSDVPSGPVDPGLMVGWFANAMEVGAQDFKSRCMVTAHQDADGITTLENEDDLPSEILISRELLLQMIERFNKLRRSQLGIEEEPPTLEESFVEGFQEGRTEE